jgi:integrase
MDLVFPGATGKPRSHGSLIKDGLMPSTKRAGLSGKYTGIHSLRHFFASWCINRVVDGGLELPAKMVQVRLGHGTISMLLDTYGHLFAATDDAAALAAGEKALLG